MGGLLAPYTHLARSKPAVKASTQATVEVSATVGRSTRIALEQVLTIVNSVAGGAVDADAPLMDAGLDSLGAVELRNQLQQVLGGSTTPKFDETWTVWRGVPDDDDTGVVDDAAAAPLEGVDSSAAPSSSSSSSSIGDRGDVGNVVAYHSWKAPSSPET